MTYLGLNFTYMYKLIFLFQIIVFFQIFYFFYQFFTFFVCVSIFFFRSTNDLLLIVGDYQICIYGHRK